MLSVYQPPYQPSNQSLFPIVTAAWVAKTRISAVFAVTAPREKAGPAGKAGPLK